MDSAQRTLSNPQASRATIIALSPGLESQTRRPWPLPATIVAIQEIARASPSTLAMPTPEVTVASSRKLATVKIVTPTSRSATVSSRKPSPIETAIARVGWRPASRPTRQESAATPSAQYQRAGSIRAANRLPQRTPKSLRGWRWSGPPVSGPETPA